MYVRRKTFWVAAIWAVTAATTAAQTGSRSPSVPAHAQAPMSPPTSPVAVDEHVIVTGTAPVAPVSVAVDPRQPRQPMPAHDGADYLDTVAGFSTVRKGGSAGDPVFRGMAGSRVSILVDDALLLGGCSSRMDTPTAYVFPETFDRITIVKGPQTVKYGAPGSAATVRFERERTPLSAPGWLGQASVLGGSWGRNDQVADIRAGTPRFYVRAAGSRSAMDDYSGGGGEPVHSHYLRWNADVAAGWTPDARTLLEVSAAGSDGRAAYADRGVDGSKFLRQGVGVRGERQRPGAALDRIEASAAYNYIDHVMDNYTLRPFVPTDMAPGGSAMNPDRTTWGGRVNTRWLGVRTTWEVGTDLQVNTHSNRSTMRQDVTPYDSLPRVSDARFTSAGAFVEGNLQARPTTMAAFGARVDRATGEDRRERLTLGMMGPMLDNPTAGLRRTDTLPSAFGRIEQRLGTLPITAFVGLGHVQRFPDYWELVTRESMTSLSAFDIEPERTTQVDAGVQLRRGRTSAWISTFVNRVDDFILIQSGVTKATATMSMGQPMGTGTAASSVRTTTVARNIEARTRGLEAGMTHTLGRLTTDASMAAVRGDNRTDGLPLAQTPPLDGRVSLAWTGERLSIGGLVRAMAAQRRVARGQGTIVGQDITATPAFAVVSVNAGWRLTSAVALAAGVDNALDASYAEHISRQGASVPGFALQTRQIREPGRTWWVRLSVRK